MLKLILKSDDKIQSTLEDWEGIKHTDGIAFSNNVIGGTTDMCTKILVDGDRFAFETLSGMYLSHKWISKVDGVTIKVGSKVVNNKYITLADNYLDVDTLTIIPSADMRICECCGAVASHVDNEGKKICNDCLIKEHYKVNGYSHKPTPIFFGKQIAADKDAPIHYGLELEYGFNNLTNMALLMMNNKELYLKSDSSIRGGEHRTEVVTHPMSFEYIMNEAKWLNELPSIDAEHRPDSNGCHIHISRTAFVDDKHYSVFYFMMHQMYDVLQFVGGREFTDYCKPKSYGKVFTKTKGSKDNANDSRSVMLNETNDSTIEARFFASTDNADDIKMYVQLLESVVKYTKYKTNCTVTGWKKYVEKYSIKYNFLNMKLGGAKDEWFNGSIQYRPPRIITKDISKITFDKLNCVSSILLKNGKTLKDVKMLLFKDSSMVKVFYDNGSRDVELATTSIDSCTWEE